MEAAAPGRRGDSRSGTCRRTGSRRRSSCTTPFPPDDRSVGYERGTSVSKAWDQATTDAAIEVAGYVVAHLQRTGRRPTTTPPTASAKLREFCRRFAERAFRRPLTDEQKQLYRRSPVRRRAATSETAVKRVVLLVLKSPRFLYREIGGGRPTPTTWPRGSRSGSGIRCPTRRCCEAAAAGQARHAASRCAARPSGWSPTCGRAPKLREFFLQWLKVDQVPDLAKDPKQFPDFDAAVASDLRTSLDLFLDDVVWSEASDFRQLLLADYAVSERPAGAVLRRRSAGRRAVPEGRARRRASGPAC